MIRLVLSFSGTVMTQKNHDCAVLPLAVTGGFAVKREFVIQTLDMAIPKMHLEC